jgi:hypothetical protein
MVIEGTVGEYQVWAESANLSDDGFSHIEGWLERTVGVIPSDIVGLQYTSAAGCFGATSSDQCIGGHFVVARLAIGHADDSQGGSLIPMRMEQSSCKEFGIVGVGS